MGLQCIGVYTGKYSSRTVSEALVKVGVEVVGYEQIVIEKLACRLVTY